MAWRYYTVLCAQKVHLEQRSCTCFPARCVDRLFSAEPRSLSRRSAAWHIACSIIPRGPLRKNSCVAEITRREEQGDESSFNVSFCNHGRGRGAERGGYRGTRGGPGATAGASVRSGAR